MRVHQTPRVFPITKNENQSKVATKWKERTNGRIVGVETELNPLIMSRSEHPFSRIIESNLVGGDGDIREESLQPAELRTGENVEPLPRRREDTVDVVRMLRSSILGLFDRMSDVSVRQHGSFVDDSRSRREVVDRGDERFVVRVEFVEEFLDEGIFDSAEEFSDRLLRRRAVLDRDRTLEDTHSLRISIEYRFDVVALPKRVLQESSAITPGAAIRRAHLLEPDAERSVENRNERNRLLKNEIRKSSNSRELTSAPSDPVVA